MSAAIAEPEVVTSREIRHGVDQPVLRGLGADLTEQALKDEYFEYRDLPTQGPGGLDLAILKMLVVHQNRRKKKAKK